MRILAIETSSRRSTIAVVDAAAGALLALTESNEPRGERLLALVNDALREAGLRKEQLERLGVGIGPGSFTGVRVGVALAQGIALGLGVPLVGVSSLRAMCRAVPESVPGVRCALLDARRNEVFLGVYGERGEEIAGAETVPRAEVADRVSALAGGRAVVVGEVAPGLVSTDQVRRASESDLPHAHFVALAAAELSETRFPAEPLYVRPADAIRPDLPRSPLSSGDPK